MDPQRYQQLMDLFDEACDLNAADQKVLLRRQLAEDRELGEALAKLLEQDAKDSDFLPRGYGGQALASQPPVPSYSGLPVGAGDKPKYSIEGVQVGNWIVHEHLGSGGVGSVHRVEHVSDGRVGAIKFLRSMGLSDPNKLKRFRQEFSAVSQFDHPGCLRVFEEGHDETGYFYVMEYIDGGDLRRLVGAETGRILNALEQIVDALAYIHQRGVVHRDLKPANVLLMPGEPPQLKLADFGIAKVLDSSSIVTGAGVVGSIDFVAPEQIVGGAVGPWTDLYSLGCLIHVLFSDQPPFTGDNFERMSGRIESVAPSLELTAPQAPAALVALVARLLARQPENRPADARSVLGELRALRQQE